MSKIWTFIYYGWFGSGDSSDDIEYDAEVSDEEYAVLEKITTGTNDEFMIKNEKLIDALQDRIQSEIEDEDYAKYDDENEPTIVVRWPWE